MIRPILSQGMLLERLLREFTFTKDADKKVYRRLPAGSPHIYDYPQSLVVSCLDEDGTIRSNIAVAPYAFWTKFAVLHPHRLLLPGKQYDAWMLNSLTRTPDMRHGLSMVIVSYDDAYTMLREVIKNEPATRPDSLPLQEPSTDQKRLLERLVAVHTQASYTPISGSTAHHTRHDPARARTDAARL